MGRAINQLADNFDSLKRSLGKLENICAVGAKTFSFSAYVLFVAPFLSCLIPFLLSFDSSIFCVQNVRNMQRPGRMEYALLTICDKVIGKAEATVR